MRVMFIYTDIGIAVGYSCGIGILSAYLKAEGHDTRLIHVSDELGYPMDFDRIVRDIRAYDPGLIAFSGSTNQWYYVKRIAEHIRRHLATPIVVGGHHANAVPHEVASNPAIDYACKGEGERPLLELVNRLETGRPTQDIPNITMRRKGVRAIANGDKRCCHAPHPADSKQVGDPVGRIASNTAALGVKESRAKVNATHTEGRSGEDNLIDNPMGQWIQDLDDLPFEDHEVFNYDAIVKTRDGWAEVIATRGCPYTCTYCFNFPFFSRYKNDLRDSGNKVSIHDYVRRRSVDSTIAMLKEIKEKFPSVKHFTFVDDLFAAHMKWLSELAPRYAEVIGLPFACTSQPKAFNEPIARLLKQMGCKVIKMGVEAGNRDIRLQVLNRMISDQVLIDVFALARRYGLKPQAFNMIGLPTETRENMLETVRLNAKLRAYIVWVSIFMPYPGTVLHDFCVNNDLLDPGRWDDVRSFRGGSVLKEASFTHLELEKMRVLFKWHLNVALDNACSAEYQRNIDELESMSADDWFGGRALDVHRQRDIELDEKFRGRQIDHYISKKYVNMLWAREYNYDLS